MQGKIEKRIRRRVRVRSKIKGTLLKPRLSVFRSSRYTYAQLIDDQEGKTLVQFSDVSLDSKKTKLNKSDKAKSVGKSLGEEMIKKGFKEIVFDRGGYKYHGRVKALADGLREAGVKF